MSKSKLTVAQFLTIKIKESSKTQKEIAAEVGYDAANVITMFKQGLTKLPLNAVGPVARALDVDPVYLLRLVFNEYYPDTFEAIEHALGTLLITENERKLIELFRLKTNNEDPEMEVYEPPEAFAIIRS